MYLIVGLGNPGREYENTRHNAGYMVVDALAEKCGIDILEKKHKALIGKGMVAGQKCILMKPLTYMNLSGESVIDACQYYKVDPALELIVISDDISLDVGKLRIRKKGSAGGHNGLKNIIAHFGNDTFMRLKVGVGNKPPRMDLADYVLGRFTEDERKLMRETAKRGAQAIEAILTEGPDKAMNLFN